MALRLTHFVVKCRWIWLSPIMSWIIAAEFALFAVFQTGLLLLRYSAMS